MKKIPKNKIENSLEDFDSIIEVSEDGFFREKDQRGGFCLKLSGLDASFFDLDKWNFLHQSWRSFLRLDPTEEWQIIFEKRGDFEEFIERKYQEIELIKNSYTRKLFLENLNQVLSNLKTEAPKLFSTQILLVYSKKFETAVAFSEMKDRLKEKAEALERLLHQKQIGAVLLSASKFQQERAAAAHGLNYVRSETMLDEWPAISISPRELKIENQTFRALVLKSLPEAYSEMGMMLSLTRLPIPLSIGLRLRGKDSSPLKKKLDRKKQMLHALSARKVAGDPHLESQFQEIDDLQRRLSDNNDALLEMVFEIGVRGNDESLLRRSLSEVLHTQSSLGQLELEEAKLSTFDSFLELIPGFRGEVFHEQTLLASNAVHFLPFFETDSGDSRPVASFQTRDGAIFSIDPVSNQLANYNWLVSGTSGSGKSFFVNSLLSQSASLHPRIFIVDIGGSYNKLTHFLGGESIGLDIKSGFKMGPFFIPKSKDPAEERRRREHIQIVFSEMLRDENRLPSVEERALLQEVLEEFFEMEKLPEHPIAAIREKLRQKNSDATRRIVLLLERWSYPSFFGEFLDHPDPLSTDKNILTFDLKGLSEFEDLSRVVQFIICSRLWSTIRQDPSKFTYIVLDEVAFSLLKSQPQFVDELISTVRKYHAGVIVIAQDLEKITSNPAGASILQNTQMKAILQQRGDPRNYAEPLNLRAPDLRAISSLDRRKGVFSDIFLLIDDRKAVIRYVPNLLEYYLATSVPAENRFLEEKMATYSGSYAERFLKFVEEVAK